MSHPLQAQEVTDIPTGQDRITSVATGDRAGYDGQLYSTDTALRWANWIVQYKNMIRVNQELQKKLCVLDTTVLEKKLELERAQYKEVTGELEEELVKAKQDADSPPFYRTALFGVVVGVVGSVALITGAAALLNAANK